MTFRPSILLRTRIAFLAVVLCALLIVGKLGYLQFGQSVQWKQAGAAASVAYRPIQATRGNIYAADGSLLATSLPFYKVAFDPCIIDEATFQSHIDTLSCLLADFYKDKSAGQYKQLIQEARQAKRRYVLLNTKQINYQDKKRLLQWPIFQKGRGRGGVIFEKIEKRFRPFNKLAFRTIGFINENNYGTGLEYYFNQALKGVNGRGLYQKMVGGNWKLLYEGNHINPVHGYDIETTIDVNLQDVAQSSLLKALQKSEAAYGCVVVMEVQTGAIKAISNLTRTDRGEYKEQYNYAVGSQGAVEPGSIFKLVPILALLEETSLALTDRIDAGKGTFQFYDRTMSDVKKGYRELTIQEAFEKSSNVVIAKLVDQVFGKNPQKFMAYIQQLGLTKPLGVQLAGEGVPFITHPNSPLWSGVTLPWMTMGYNIKITPLQMLCLYNAVANKGTMIQPIIVKKIKQANKVIKTFQGAVLCKKICTDPTLEKLKALLEGTVAHGNSRRIKHTFYKIAGKSGTANKVKDGTYTHATHTSFIGYFPAEAPRYSCIVVIDEPKGETQHFGSQTAAPVLKDIVDRIAGKDLMGRAYSTATVHKKPTGIFPLIKAGNRQDLAYLCDALHIPQVNAVAADWVRATIQNDRIVWKVQDNFGVQQVPTVLGMTLKDALCLLENRVLHVVIQGAKSGRVKTQSLLPGTKIRQDSTLTIQLD